MGSGGDGGDVGGGAVAVSAVGSSTESDSSSPRYVTTSFSFFSSSSVSSPLSLMSKTLGGGGALSLPVRSPPATLLIPPSPRCAIPSLISSSVCTRLTADATPADSTRARTISLSPAFHSRSVPNCPTAASRRSRTTLTAAVFLVALPPSQEELRDDSPPSRRCPEGRSGVPGTSLNSGARIFCRR